MILTPPTVDPTRLVYPDRPLCPLSLFTTEDSCAIGTCPTCGGSGVAPVGTPIGVRATHCGTSERDATTGVVAVGKLADPIQAAHDSAEIRALIREAEPGYLIVLSEVRWLDPPITHWPCPCGMHDPGPNWETASVADLPAGWCTAPQGLTEAVS